MKSWCDLILYNFIQLNVEKNIRVSGYEHKILWNFAFVFKPDKLVFENFFAILENASKNTFNWEKI